MSVAMLSSMSVSFYQWVGVKPVAAAPATSATSTSQVAPVRRHDHGDDDRPRVRETTLVSAMMSAFRALGIGQPSAAVTTPPVTTGVPAAATTPAAVKPVTLPATASVNSPAVVIPTALSTSTSSGSVATNTSGVANATALTPATAEKLEKAVNEFAHALFALLHRQGRNERSEGEHGRRREHHHEGHRGGGYGSFVQRLEQLAQSLSAAPPAGTGAAPAPASTTPAVAPVQAASVPAAAATPIAATSGAELVSPAPSRSVARLLAAFSKVMDLLQPAATTATVPASPVTTAAPAPAASSADKLKLFLTTLAQTLRAADSQSSPSPVGSRVNVTV